MCVRAALCAGRRGTVRVAASVTAEKAALDITKVSPQLVEQHLVWVAMVHSSSGRV